MKSHRGMERVAVIDFDVHHGNGTQDVLCRTHHPAFLYASIHAFNKGGGDGSHPRIFPGTGAAGEAHDNVLNIPLGDQVGSGGFAHTPLPRHRTPCLVFCLPGWFDGPRHPECVGSAACEVTSWPLRLRHAWTMKHQKVSLLRCGNSHPRDV